MPDVFFHVPAGARTFEMKVRSVAPKPQTVTVSDGDQVLGKVRSTTSRGSRSSTCCLLHGILPRTGFTSMSILLAGARRDTRAGRADAGTSCSAMGGNLRNRLKSVVAPALLVVLPLCLFGPHTIFSGNEAEFSAPFWMLVRPSCSLERDRAHADRVRPPFCRPDCFARIVALLFGLGVVIWIQGSFLVADYGPLDGTAIDWTLQSWRNPYEMALWTLVPGLCVVAPRLRRRHRPVCERRSRDAADSRASGVEPCRPMRRRLREWRGPSDSMFELSRNAERHPHRPGCISVRLLSRDSRREPAGIGSEPVRRGIFRRSQPERFRRRW